MFLLFLHIIKVIISEIRKKFFFHPNFIFDFIFLNEVFQKGNTSNIEYMNNIFKNCISLISLTDIDKWNISKVKKKKGKFEECINLLNIKN